MRHVQPDPNCIACKGTGWHSPIVAWGAVSEVEDKKRRAELPDHVECGCTFVWEMETNSE